MRLKDVYYIGLENLDDISRFKHEKTIIAGTGYIRVYNWGEVFNAFEKIKKIEYLKDNVNATYSVSPVLLMGKEAVDLEPIQFNELERLRNSIFLKLNSIKEYYESLNIPDAEDCLEIKMPRYNKLSDFLAYIKDLNFIISNPYLLEYSNDIEFNRIDLGSTWLVFAGIAAGVNKFMQKLAKIVDQAMIVHSHHINCNEQKENLRTMGIKNDFIESLTEQFNEASSKILDSCIDSIEKDLGKLDSPDRKSVV